MISGSHCFKVWFRKKEKLSGSVHYSKKILCPLEKGIPTEFFRVFCNFITFITANICCENIQFLSLYCEIVLKQIRIFFNHCSPVEYFNSESCGLTPNVNIFSFLFSIIVCITIFLISLIVFYFCFYRFGMYYCGELCYVIH